MRVYVPFDDGSVVAYDGKNFTIHRRPVGYDADLRFMAECAAELAWQGRRGDLVKALSAAWWKKYLRHKEKEVKRLYSKPF